MTQTICCRSITFINKVCLSIKISVSPKFSVASWPPLLLTAQCSCLNCLSFTKNRWLKRCQSALLRLRSQLQAPSRAPRMRDPAPGVLGVQSREPRTSHAAELKQRRTQVCRVFHDPGHRHSTCWPFGTIRIDTLNNYRIHYNQLIKPQP